MQRLKGVHVLYVYLIFIYTLYTYQINIENKMLVLHVSHYQFEPKLIR